VVLTLLGCGVFFGVLLVASSLLRTLVRKEQIGFLDFLLASLAVAITVAALIVNAAQEAPDGAIDRGALLLSFAVVGFSLLILLVDASRGTRLRSSRGLLGLVTGLLITLAAIALPFAAAYVTLAANPPFAPPELTEEATQEPGGTPQLLQRTNRFNELFAAVRTVVMQEIDIDEVFLFSQLDTGMPLAQIVKDHGGSVDQVVLRISEIMRVGVREAAAAGEMNPLEAALLVSQMETLIGLAASTDIVAFSVRFGGPTPPAEGVRPSLLTLLTETPDAPTGSLPLQPTLIPTPTV
jgi:hypothetical protein